MKISAISSYRYKKQNLDSAQEPSFEGKLRLQETANKVFTKKNLFEAGLLLVLLSKLADIADIDVSEIVDFVKNTAIISFFAVTEPPKQLEENIELCRVRLYAPVQCQNCQIGLFTDLAKI